LREHLTERDAIFSLPPDIRGFLSKYEVEKREERKFEERKQGRCRTFKHSVTTVN
jgi:hypothetical protein